MATPLDNGRPHLWLASHRGEAKPRPPESQLDDAQLLDAIRRGDPSAAGSLHDRARPLVVRTVARLLGRSDWDCEDLVQQALIELVTTIERFRGDCSLDGWISMITARVVYKHIRKRKTERRVFGGPIIDDAIAAQRTGRDAALRGLIDRVRTHLDALEPNKAWTFLLHDVCGYDLREIAEITGASVAAAQTRLTRGRRELHERIASDPELTDWIEETGGVLWTIPAYARLAAKLLKREQESLEPPAPPGATARADAVAAIERALVERARRRVLRRSSYAGLGVAAAAALAWFAFGPRAQPAHAPVAVNAAHAQDIIVHPFGSGARVFGASADGALQRPGARVQALPRGRALLAFASGTRVTLEEEGDLTLLENGAAQVLALDRGALRADVAKLAPGRRFLVHTADAEVEVHGTSFRVSLAGDGARCGGAPLTQVEVFEGVVSVRNGGSEQRIEKGGRWSAACPEPAVAAASASEPATNPEQVARARTPRVPAPQSQPALAASSRLSEQNRVFASAVAAHRSGDAERAAREFDQLIGHFPDGPLAESATVQRLKLMRDLDRTRAQALARDYLARYPDGFARKLAEAIAEPSP